MPYGIELAKAAGAQASGGAINRGLGLLFAGPERKAQMKTAKQMQELQMKGDKEMTDYNMKKQLEMWEATGYGAQVDQMKRAGINPALLYGMGSGGVQTANVETGNVSGQNAGTPIHSGGTEGMGLMISQMTKTQAETDLLKAQARLANTEADKKEGVDTQEAKGRIDSLKLSNEFLSKTLEYRVDIVHSEMSKAINDLTLQDGAIERERSTRVTDIQKARAEAVNAILTSQAIKANTEYTKQSIEESKANISKINAEIEKISNEIALGWDTLDVRKLELQLKAWEADIKAKYPGLWNVFGRILNETANGIGELINQKPDTEKNPIKK